MKRILAFLSFFPLYGQTAPATPKFEVASVRPSGPLPTEHVNIGVHIDGARISCNFFSLTDLIRLAFNIKQYQVTGPDWLASDRFDIAAKLPAGAAQDQVRDMMKALLIDRFDMKTHPETKDFPVYGLVVAKNGVKMKESAPSGEPETQADPSKAPVNVTASGGASGVRVAFGKGSYFSFADEKLEARRIAMPRFAEMLARFEDRPVVDMTGLKGEYDIDIDFSPDDYRAMLIRSAVSAGVSLPPEALKMMEGASGDSMLNAMEKLGLKLETRKAPLEVVVVDHISRMPTEN